MEWAGRRREIPLPLTYCVPNIMHSSSYTSDLAKRSAQTSNKMEYSMETAWSSFTLVFLTSLGRFNNYFPRSCSVNATNKFIHAVTKRVVTWDRTKFMRVTVNLKHSLFFGSVKVVRVKKEKIYRVYEINNTLSGYCRIFWKKSNGSDHFMKLEARNPK